MGAKGFPRERARRWTFAILVLIGCGPGVPSRSALDATNTTLECGGADDAEGSALATGEQNVVLEQVDVHCRWEGAEIPVYARDDHSLFYLGPFKPLGPYRLDELVDPDGRTIRFGLRTTVPDLVDACPDASADLVPRLHDARPIPVGLISLEMVDPVTSRSCNLRSAGASHEQGADEVIRLRLPDRDAATRVLHAIASAATEMPKLRVRVGLLATVRAPQCQLRTEQSAQVSARSVLDSLRNGVAGAQGVTDVYVSGSRLAVVHAELAEHVAASLESFGDAHCDPTTVAAEFADEVLHSWGAAPIAHSEMLAAIDQAITAAGPDGDEEAFATCRHYIHQNYGVSVGVTIPDLIDASGHFQQQEGATGTACPGRLEVHRLHIADIRATQVRTFIANHFSVPIEQQVELQVAGGLCSETCEGCCTSRGECVDLAAQTPDRCGAADAGALCTACSGLTACANNQCEPVEEFVGGHTFSVTLSEVRDSGDCDSGGNPCDVTVMLWRPDHPEHAQRFAGRDDAGAVQPETIYATGTAAELSSPFRLSVTDRDVVFDDARGTCDLQVDLGKLRDAVQQHASVTQEVVCGSPGTVVTLAIAEVH